MGKQMPVIGIDLGTSSSAAAVLKDGKPVIIPGPEGFKTNGKPMPSYVALTAKGEILVGEEARRQATVNPEGTITAFKRKMGQREEIILQDHEFCPEQLSAYLLQKLKRDAEIFLGEPVTKAVVSVPAYFNDNQRAATKDACQIAGIEPIRLLNEPTAAALAYGLERRNTKFRIGVLALGAGNFGFTILEFDAGVLEVLSTSGDTAIGGIDMNRCIYDDMAGRFIRLTGFNIRNDPHASARLLEAAETAKLELSTTRSSIISLPYIGKLNGEVLNFELELDRAQLDKLMHPILERCRQPIQRAMEDSGLLPSKLDRIVLAGGPTRMPIVRSYFETLLGRRAEPRFDPIECVAHGTAIEAGILLGQLQHLILLEVTPLTLWMEGFGGITTPLIMRNTTIPTRHAQILTTSEDMQRSLPIRLYQGEHTYLESNTGIGNFRLENLVPALSGVPKIEVTFDIDESGILSVKAKDSGALEAPSLRVTDTTHLSKKEKEHLSELLVTG